MYDAARDRLGARVGKQGQTKLCGVSQLLRVKGDRVIRKLVGSTPPYKFLFRETGHLRAAKYWSEPGQFLLWCEDSDTRSDGLATCHELGIAFELRADPRI